MCTDRQHLEFTHYLLRVKQLVSVNGNYKFQVVVITFDIYELPNIPLLDDSSAPSLYPKTLNTYHQTF